MTHKPSINNVLQLPQQKLSETSNSARTDGEVLLAHVLDCTRTYLRTWPKRIFTIA